MGGSRRQIRLIQKRAQKSGALFDKGFGVGVGVGLLFIIYVLFIIRVMLPVLFLEVVVLWYQVCSMLLDHRLSIRTETEPATHAFTVIPELASAFHNVSHTRTLPSPRDTFRSIAE